MVKKSKKKIKKSKKLKRTNMDLLEKKLSSIGSGIHFKPKEGKNVIRILPPWNDEGWPFKEMSYHYGLKKEGKDVVVPGPNPIIMDCIKKLEKKGSEDKKLAKRLAPRTKYYANVLERKSGKIMIWGFSGKVLGTILRFMEDPDWGDITDPEEGFDVVVDRAGTGLETKYEVRVKPRSSELGDIDLDQMHDLDELEQDFSDDEVVEMLEEFLGGDYDDDEEDDDRPSKKKKRKKQEEEEDEDEEEEDDEEVDDEEDEEEEEDYEEDEDEEQDDDDEDDEDDEEEDEDDEEEEEEEPVKKKKKKAKTKKVVKKKTTKKKKETKKKTKKKGKK